VSWDWAVDATIGQTYINKTQSKANFSIPSNARSATFVNDADNRLYTFGGSVSNYNISFPGYTVPDDEKYSLYSYDLVTDTFERYPQTNLTTHPASCAAANIPALGLGFCYGGMIDNGTDIEVNMNSTPKAFLTGMVVLDLNSQTSRNLSTKAVEVEGRSRAGLHYVPGIGQKGILVMMGGGIKAVDNYNSSFAGSLVCNSSNALSSPLIMIPGSHELHLGI
jgi:hypothetical protein